MSAKDFSEHYRRISPGGWAAFCSTTQDEFLSACEQLIGSVIGTMERSRSTYRTLGEVGLSTLMVDLLCRSLVKASAEKRQNGHVDVTIEHSEGFEFRHITECKVWDGNRYHASAVAQILGYATGREGRVMCLEFFIHHKKMVFLMKRLRDAFDTQQLKPLANGLAADHPEPPSSFATSHTHVSGSTIVVVHAACYLWEEDERGEGDDAEGDDAVVGQPMSPV